MDTKSKVAIILVLMAVVLAWPRLVDFFYAKQGWSTQPTAPTTQPATASTQPGAIATSQPGAQPGLPATQANALVSLMHAIPATQPLHAALGSAFPNDPKFRLQLDVDTTGAGIDAVILNEFRKSVDNRDPYIYQRPYESFENLSRPLATVALHVWDHDRTLTSLSRNSIIATVTTAQPGDFYVGEQIDVEGAQPSEFNGAHVITAVNTNGFQYEVQPSTAAVTVAASGKVHARRLRTIDLTGAQWNRGTVSPQNVSYSLDVNDEVGPLARLTKTYEVYDRTDATNGGGYEVQIRQTVQNLTHDPIQTALTFNGPTTPPRELDRGSDRMMIGGYLDKDSVHINQNYVESFNAKQATQNYTKSDKGLPLLWAGAASVYFDALLRPIAADANAAPAGMIEHVEAMSLNPDAEDAKAHLVTMIFQTTQMSLQAGAKNDIVLRAFFGPKNRELLRNDYYSKLPLGYNSTLVITSGLCGVCTFGWLIDALVWLLKGFHLILRDWGLSIIALVALVRLCLHPITKKSQQNMSHMSKFGPELDKIKKKYADQPDEMNKAMMAFYKEHGATPILGCLPMFLQMPIWIALWQSLQTTFELRHAPFLRFGNVHLTWIKDLSQPDHLIAFQHPITLWILTISGLNILPILMGITMIIQQKYFTPQPPTMTDEQRQQQKMMQWMSGLLFPLMLYAGPSGLNLYIFTSTTFGIIESKVIRKHIKEREDAEKAGKVIIDGGKKFGRGRGKSGDDDEPKKPGRLGKWIADLQAKAEQIQRDAQRRK